MIKWNFGARTASEWIGQDSISEVKFHGKVCLAPQSGVHNAVPAACCALLAC